MPPLVVDPGVLPAFALAMVLIELTPGPNLAYLALLSARRGRRAGLSAVAGVTAGLAVWLLVTLVGLTRTPLFSPSGLESLRWVGAAYLLWLAYDALRMDGRPAARWRGRGAGPFARGLAANLLNPKAAIFYLALLPGFISTEAGPVWAQIAMLGLLHITISVLIHGAIVMGAAEAATRLPSRLAQGFRVALALGLLGTTAWLISLPLAGGGSR
jgi:threonine/homoserine/homoserine lactone efflux protein